MRNKGFRKIISTIKKQIGKSEYRVQYKKLTCQGQRLVPMEGKLEIKTENNDEQKIESPNGDL